MFKNLIRKPYYYVPACPCCQSMGTGYYVKENSVDPTFTLREALKNGELVLSAKEIPYDNAFCLSCGFTWHQQVKLRFLSLSEIEDQKRMRDSVSFYNSLDLGNKPFLSKFL